MFRLLFILFITVPLVELYCLIQVGDVLGVIPTIALCIFTAALGAALLRYQGLQTIARIQQRVATGEVPATDMLEGAILLLSGVLLMTPGFLTDVIGFLCLTPKLRTWAATGFLNNLFQHRTKVNIHESATLDGEFWEEENKRLND